MLYPLLLVTWYHQSPIIAGLGRFKGGLTAVSLLTYCDEKGRVFDSRKYLYLNRLVDVFEPNENRNPNSYCDRMSIPVAYCLDFEGHIKIMLGGILGSSG
jgi:hypothetical protein